jgi:hypothetical protein
MKKLFIVTLSVVAWAACQNPQNNSEEVVTADTTIATGSWGAKFEESGVISMDSLVSLGDSGKLPIEGLRVSGLISECCQKKGCWMSISKPDGNTMRVTFKDYAFFVPKNAAGYTAVMQGRAYMDTIQVEDLRHYAEDAGASKDSIAKITEPALELSFEADGVVIRQ